MIGLSPFEAQAKLASLPTSPDSIKYLMALANGANPEIPRFMALGRLEQMKQEMANNKPAQPPQGTVKDKIEQAAGIMALRGGQQPQQPAMQPQAAPQGIPQPQMQPQPEEVQTGADGGLMRARIDPRMFNFAPGGIVSFDDGGGVLDKAIADRKAREAEIRTYGTNQRRADPEGYQAKEAALAAAVQQENEARERYEADMAKSGAARPAFNRRDVGAVKETLGIASIPKEKPQLQGPRVLTGDAAAEQDRLAKAREAFNAPPVAAPPPPPPVVAAPAAALAAAPAAAPRPTAGAPRPPAAAAPGLSQGVGELAKTLTPEVDESKVRAAYGKAAPTTRSIEEIAAEQNKIQELTGVGTYGKNRREQIANMRHEFEQSRPSTSEDVIDMIRAGARPGARAGDIAGEYSGQAKREREAKLAFSKAEDALKDAVEKADEAVRSGKATDIVRARDEERKAQADYKKAEVDLEKSIMTTKATASSQGLQAATQLTTTGMSNLTSLQVANIHAAATKAGLTKPSESERVGAEYRRILGASGQKAADAFLADESKVRAAVSGVKYEGQPEKKAAIELKVQEEVRKRVPNIDLKLQNPKLSPADRAKYEAARELVEKDVRRKLRNATGDEEGGSGSEAPKRLSEEEYNKARPGTVFLAPDGSTRIKQ